MAKKKDKDIEKAEKPKMRPSNQMEMFTYLKDNPDVKGMKQIEMDRMRGIITDDDPRAPINTEGTNNEAVRERVLKHEQLLRDIDKYRESKVKAAKGGSMSKQMEMFEDGGLKDEGGMIDEVSGNDVPSGSTREEVRDDIPAQLSEGEFVFPADVVRFIGLEKLMQMRQKAKMGLQKMEDMGQMGNSEEAIIPDDMPFSIDDLDIEEEVDNQAEMEYNKGGVVYAQQGTYLPNVGKAYQPPAAPKNAGTPYAPANYGDLLGTSAGGAPKTQNVRYVNEATGQVRMIPHVLNADGTIGNSLYPRPDGFVKQEEAVIEPVKETQVQSTKVAPVESGDDSRDQEEREREEAMYGPGGGRISLGGTIKEGTTVKTGFGSGKNQKFSSLTKDATTFGIGYTVPGSLPGIYGALANVISIGTKGVPEGGTGKFTLGGVTLTKSAEVTNAIIKKPMGPEAQSLIDQHTDARKSLRDLKQSNPNLSNRQAQAIVDAFVQADKVTGDNGRITYSIENIDSKVRDAYIDAVEDASKNDDGSFNVDNYNSLPSGVQDVYNESVTQKEDDQQQYGTVGDTNIGLGTDTYDSGDDSSYDGGYDSGQDTSFEGSYEDDDMYNKGGLAGKKKTPKPKKMKRGGLASR